MDLFYIPNFIPGQPTLNLPADESHHARKVLRKKRGDLLRLTDGRGYDITTIIQNDKGQQLELLIQKQEKISFPPENMIEVALSTIRPNRMDWAVEKLTELGVQTIVPLYCHYTNYRQIKIDHLRKITISAMKQSRQFYLPEIKSAVNLEEWLMETSQQPGLKYLTHPCLKRTEKITKSKLSEKFFIMVGPEGGFHPDEISRARQVGFELLPLGQTILRTETAAVSGVVHLKILRNRLIFQ